METLLIIVLSLSVFYLVLELIVARREVATRDALIEETDRRIVDRDTVIEMLVNEIVSEDQPA